MNSLIKWSDRYIIVSDKKKCLFYVIDIIDNRIISKISKNVKDFIKSFKKVKHPLLGECLITCNHAHLIQIWALPTNYFG